MLIQAKDYQEDPTLNQYRYWFKELINCLNFLEMRLNETNYLATEVITIVDILIYSEI